MKILKQNYSFLRVLSHFSPIQKRALLCMANKGKILALCEVYLNVLSGNVPCRVNKLRKYCNIMRKLANKTTKLAQKKKNYKSKWSFLPLVLRAVGPILTSMLGQVLSN